MTPESALSLMLSRTHEAMGKPRECAYCGHEKGEHYRDEGVCTADVECPCRDYEPPVPISAECRRSISPRPVVAQQIRDVTAIITQRGRECYGAPWQGDAQQADEMARAIVQLFLMRFDMIVPALCPKCKIPPSNASDVWEYVLVCNNCFDADCVGDPPAYVSRSIIATGNTMEAAIADWNERVEERTAT